jgi:hypothetical protein
MNAGSTRAGTLAGLLVVALLIASAAYAMSSGEQAKREPVLGSKNFAPGGKGFGEVAPHKIFNGGDPSGLVTHIHWKHWGADTARAHGDHPIFKPGGGYYSKPSHSILRASDLGKCPNSNRLAYRKLKVRDQKRPGGPRGHWYSWSGFKTICKGFGAHERSTG